MLSLFTNKIFIILLLLPYVVYSQVGVNYSGRNLISSSDSTFKNLTAYSSGGSVDPDEYLIGAGDKIEISIRGINEKYHILMVNLEGRLNIPDVGVVNINKLSLNEARKIIENKILTVYKDVEINISLINKKFIKVSVVGIDIKPSSYVIPAGTRLMDLISISGGISNNTDLRNIIVTSFDNNKKKYDLISFTRLGDRSNNPYINDEDIISFSRIDKTVSVNGAVNGPGSYEFVDGETAMHLLNIAGGASDKAKLDTIEIAGYQEDNKTLISKFYSFNELNNVLMKRGDKIIIREKPEYLIEQFVIINGRVKFPGIYKIVRDQVSLKHLLINEAGGFLEDASLKDSYILRNSGTEVYDPEFERLKQIPRVDLTEDEYDYLKSKSRLIKGKMVLDFERLFLQNDLSEDIILVRGDEIFIPEAKNYLTIVGQVNNPGNIIYRPGLKISDYIKLAGGFGWRALENDVRVIKKSTGEWMDEDDVEELQPGDIIWIPENPPGPKFWDVFQTSLIIVGQVATVIAATVAVIVAVR